MFNTSGKPRRVEAAVFTLKCCISFISQRQRFLAKRIREKDGHYKKPKGSIHQEDVTVKTYARNIGTPKYFK